MISLLALVQTGRLGVIGLGATKAEVELAFGPPPDWDAPSGPESALIWKYGSVEIYFDKDRVWMIFTDDFRLPLSMEDVAFDACGINGRMDQTQVYDWLVGNSIEFQRMNFLHCDEGIRFETSSGITFTLCAEEKGETAFLCSFALAHR